MLTVTRWTFALLIVATSAALAHAGAVGGVVVSVQVVDANDLVVIRLAGTATSPPGCATADTSAMVGDLKKPAGRAMLAVALASKASGLSVGMLGGNMCTRLSGYEDAVQIFQ